MIEPKKVIGSIDPPLLTLRELREPVWKEPLRAWDFWKSHALGRRRPGTGSGECCKLPGGD